MNYIKFVYKKEDMTHEAPYPQGESRKFTKLI